MITNIRKNCVGTISFDGKFHGFRKFFNFIVYPMKQAQPCAMVQSDTRIGWINLTTGAVALCPPVSSGAYQPHLRLATHIDTLNAEELLMLKAQIMATASKQAGGNGVIQCDNSGALEVFT